jgi:uncharacterized protein (DUF2141 family)
MLKKAMLFLASFLLASAFAYAEEKFSLSGQVTFSGHENIYVSLYTMEEFANFKKSLPSPLFSQKIKPNPEQIKAGRFSFTFSGVPKGSYCIIAFQDLDNNGKLTCDTWGKIEEVICFYKEPTDIGFGTPNWHNVKFDVVSDITGIIMKLD